MLLLPYIEGTRDVRTKDGRSLPLHEAFHYDEPWDSPHNKQLLSFMPSIYWSPLTKTEGWKTNYLGVSGENMMFPGKKGVKKEDFKDGKDRTIALVEVGDELAVEWTRPMDFLPNPKEPAKGLRNFPWAGQDRIHVGMVDGSDRLMSLQLKPDLLWSAFILNDGKPDSSGF